MYIYNFEIHADKLKHFLISLLIFLVIFYVRKYIIKNKGHFRVVSYSIRDVLVIGLFKEFIDLFGFGHPELADLLADTIGVFIAIYIFYLIRETRKIEESKFFKYEIKLINQLKINIKGLFKKTVILLKIKYTHIFYKRKIILALENRIVKYYFRKGLIDFGKIFNSLVLFTFIWLINLIYLVFKIPFLALYDTFEVFTLAFDSGIKRVNKIGIKKY